MSPLKENFHCVLFNFSNERRCDRRMRASLLTGKCSDGNFQFCSHFFRVNLMFAYFHCFTGSHPLPPITFPPITHVHIFNFFFLLLKYGTFINCEPFFPSFCLSCFEKKGPDHHFSFHFVTETFLQR